MELAAQALVARGFKTACVANTGGHIYCIFLEGPNFKLMCGDSGEKLGMDLLDLDGTFLDRSFWSSVSSETNNFRAVANFMEKTYRQVSKEMEEKEIKKTPDAPKTPDLMTPIHDRWPEFADKMSGAEGCNFAEVTRNGKKDFTWTCDNTPHHPITRKILESMGFDPVSIEQSVGYFKGHGGMCDCEVVFNVYESVKRAFGRDPQKAIQGAKATARADRERAKRRGRRHPQGFLL